MRSLVKSTLRYFGYDLVRSVATDTTKVTELNTLSDFTEDQKNIVSMVRPFTMTSIDRIAALINATTYITTNKIPGDVAECGVWKGGSMMAVALTLLAHNDTDRSLYLYDTYEGMSAPSEEDKSFDGASAKSQLELDTPGTGIWCYSSLQEVQANIFSTGYPKDKIHIVKGKVEDTIPGTIPSSLSLLRLDTDWYESTKHEMNYLFPFLDKKGILIVDDYGHWQGAKKAVDEYFRELNQSVYLHRIDYTGRIVVGISS